MIKADKFISLPSKTLPWVLPTLLVLAPKDSSCIILSPWVENLVLNVGVLQGKFGMLCGEVTFIDLLYWLYNEHRKSFWIYVREADGTDKRLYPFVEANKKGILHLRQIPNLHAKLVITNLWILETSANLLWRSYNVNVENVNLLRNPLQDAVKYLKEFKVIQGVY
ncbi:MAG: hypothetical protein QXM93_09240 [Candidatus Methanomethyliaceae archaeon]